MTCLFAVFLVLTCRYVMSLSLPYEELVSTLVNLNVNFDVVAVSEIWYAFDNPIQIIVECLDVNFFLASHIAKMVVYDFI